MASKKTVLIVDDHPLFRQGIKALLDKQPGYEVVDEAGSGKEAIQKAKKLKPDLVVMDISLPDQSGIDATREIIGFLPATRIMILSMHSKIDYIAEAFQAGAFGYVVKESAVDGLIKGLDIISKGEYFLDNSLSHEVVNRLMETPTNKTKVKDLAYGALTPREQEVLRLLAEGMTPKVIGEKLFISPKTVENHRANIMSKLDLHSTLDLVRYAAKLGLIDVDLWKG
ncbi:MAG: response regulator transcription factor [Desulfobacterium sp.]|nr:response regulator transcription factor [Desulfobacterium sp.]MBU3947718.1 response regulator transcription factor [Pseudomonadota bacterium]MBU4009374.1 response regulator transcription factor [Pseudomonadota bacterium]MBU4036396.1 response regulator transcription factor [Pseudomonadota bacterium]